MPDVTSAVRVSRDPSSTVVPAAGDVITTVGGPSGITLTTTGAAVPTFPLLSIAPARIVNWVTPAGTVKGAVKTPVKGIGIALSVVPFTENCTRRSTPELSVAVALRVIVCPSKTVEPATGEVITTVGSGSG